MAMMPVPAGKPPGQTESWEERAEQARIFAQLGQIEYERVLLQRRLDAALAEAAARPAMEAALAEAHARIAELTDTASKLRSQRDTQFAARRGAEEARDIAQARIAALEEELAGAATQEAVAAATTGLAAERDAALARIAGLEAELAAAAAGREAAGLAQAAAEEARDAALRSLEEATARIAELMAEREAGNQAAARLRRARQAAQNEATAARAEAERLQQDATMLITARAEAENARNRAIEETMALRVELMRLRAGAEPRRKPDLSATPAPAPAAPGEPVAFDEAWYLKTYPDVRAAVAAEIFSSGLDHFLQHGRAEGRQPLPEAMPAAG
ncbi:hypothetical protein JMJ55_11230 [Belnapia sp. T6]|uniref:Uncharacterized protein n=1 Tax=Belnapia mucosa TaxID=2804532 RepID=A0ABS1V2G7_9PROT|nr:hypothetical protein [Belnapia mucosa]MBL6455897.1 hypothetical protein [Belnapia mucosa]